MGDYRAKKAQLPHHREQLNAVRSQAMRHEKGIVNKAAAGMENMMAHGLLRGALINPNINATQFRGMGQGLVLDTKRTWGL